MIREFGRETRPFRSDSTNDCVVPALAATTTQSGSNVHEVKVNIRLLGVKKMFFANRLCYCKADSLKPCFLSVAFELGDDSKLALTFSILL